MNYVRRLLLLMSAVIFCTFINAQNKGNISGVVKDGTGEILPGATIVVKGTTLGTATDLNGLYTLQGIPAGKCIVVVSYLGYEPLEKNLTISPGKNQSVDFVLKELSIELQGITVSGVLNEQQRALNQQKVADNLMQVVSAEQMGRFPDVNVSDALKRLSGVTSDGKEIQLRGTPANFTNINVNGEQIMGSQEGGKRNETMDVIPTDILSSMEVQKTLLPSNDGDAIAGVINMRTGIARSLKPSFTVDLGSGYAFIRDKVNYNAKVSYSQRFLKTNANPDGAFGVKLNYSYMVENNGYDRLEAEAWEPYDLKDAKTGDVISEGTYFPTDFRYRYQNLKSTRHGVSVALDWQPTKFTKFVLSSLFNYRDEDGDRYRFRTRFRSQDGYYLMPDGTIGSKRMRSISQVTASDETVHNFNINLDGETSFGTWKIDGGLFYTKSKRDYFSEMDGFQTPDWRVGKKVNKEKIPNDAIIGVIPGINKYLTSTYIFEPFGKMGNEPCDDISRFNLYTQENWNYKSGGDNFTVRLNVNKNYFIKSFASTFSAGAKGKFMSYYGSVPENTLNYSFTASDANSLSNMLYRANLSGDWLGGHMSYFGPVPDIGKIRAYVNSSASESDKTVNEYTTGINRDGYYYDANENVAAGYMMNKMQINKLMFLAGFRVEYTHVDYKANKLDPFVNPDAPIQNDDETLYNDYKCTKVSSKLHYTKFLPNIQFKYDLTDNTIFRLAWTTGYSRPNVSDLVPKQSVNQDLQRVTIGNPDLEAAYGHNLDFLFEHYLSNVGIISGGIFYKHISNFIYTSEGIIDDPTSTYNGWQVMQTKNGDAAKLYGGEITVNSSLTFLPGFLKNLVFTGNFTYIHSKAMTSQERGSMRLPGQAKTTANLALAYSCKRFTLQASFNYIGKYIQSLGSSSERDIWRDGRWQMDINGNIQIIKGLTFWAEAVNLLNSENYFYFGDKSRCYTSQFNGTIARCGLTYKF